MKTDDFFEALSDIDEELIANAKPLRNPNEVVVSRAPLWKTIASCGAAAACVAALVVGSVFGIKYISGRNAADPPASGTSAAISYTKSDCSITEPEKIELINEEDFDGVILTVVKDKSSYGQGEEIKVTATVRNTTDKPIGLLMPCEGEGSHTEISTWIERAARYLPDISIADKAFDTAMDSRIVEPGGEYIQEMTFGTFYYIRDTKMTAMPGVYKGTAGISLLAEPNDTSSETTPCSVNFELEITGDENIQPPVEKIVDNYKSGDKIPEDGLKFTMPEFPGTEFEIRNSGVFANGERLFGGITVYSVYLCDLNGDGKREIISGSSDLYKDSKYSDYVKVYNNANGKLYWFAEDPWGYDLWLDVKDDSLIAMRTCKPEFSNTRDTTAFPLTLEYLEECPAQSENAAIAPVKNYEGFDIKHNYTWQNGIEFCIEYYCSNENEPVYSTVDGVLGVIGQSETHGNYITVIGDDGYLYHFAGLKEVFDVNGRITAGQQLGVTGKIGENGELGVRYLCTVDKLQD